MRVEAWWYEACPYVYFVTGVAATLFSTSSPGLLFSALLLSAALTIFRRRRIYRSPERQAFRKYSRPH